MNLLNSKRSGVPAILAASLFTLVVGTVAARRIDVRTADTPRYQRLAENIDERGDFSSCATPPFHPEIQRVPGYPVFLALLRRFGITSNTGIATAQALLHALAVLAVAGLAPRHPVVVAWVFALYPYSLVISLKLASEGLSEFLLLWGLIFVAWAVRSHPQRTSLFVLGGLTLSALTFTRPVFLFLPVTLGLALGLWRQFCPSPKFTRRGVFIFILCGTLPAASWSARTSWITGRLMPPSLNWIGTNLWLATWDYRASYHDLEYNIFRREDNRNEGVIMDLNECNPVENLAASDHAREVAVRRIRRNPGTYLLESLWRSLRVWLTWEISEPSSRNLAWASHWLRYSSILILSLGLAGAWLLRRDLTATVTITLPCIYISAIHMPLHVSGRYSHPARGLVLILAVYALSAVVRRCRPWPSDLAPQRIRSAETQPG